MRSVMLMNVQGNVSLKKSLLDFQMEDTIIQSKFMKDYKAIFRDSIGSGKHGKCLKIPYVEKPWII